MIDPRTLAPLDTQTILESVDKTGRLVLVDQATRHASVSTVIAGEVAEHGFSSLKAPIVQVTALDATIPYSEPLEAWVLPNEDKIVAAVQQVLGVGARDGVIGEAHGGQALRLLATMWRIRLFEEQVGVLARAGEARRARSISASGRRASRPPCARSSATTTRCTRGTARTGTRSRRARRSSGMHGGADGARRRAVPRARRLDAPRRRRARLHGRDGRRRRQHPDRARERARRAAARRRRGRGRLLRRRRSAGAAYFNETVNLATLWGLPLLLVCENNGFAEFTPRSAHTNVERVSDVVAPYDVERETVDGNDVGAVWDAFGGFLAPARTGGGPFLLECLTHRLRGHYEGDPGEYREALAAAEWQEKDPIVRLQRTRSREAGSAERARRRGGAPRSSGRSRSRARARSRRASCRRAGLRGCLRRPTSRRSPRRSPTAMRADERVFVLGEDVAEGGPYTATAGLAEEFGTGA